MGKTPHTPGPQNIRRRIHGTGEADLIQEVASSSNSYGGVKLTPSLTPYLEILIWIPTIMNQWIIACIIGGSKRRISTVITATSNGAFSLSVDGMLRKEALVVL